MRDVGDGGRSGSLRGPGGRTGRRRETRGRRTSEEFGEGPPGLLGRRLTDLPLGVGPVAHGERRDTAVRPHATPDVVPTPREGGAPRRPRDGPVGRRPCVHVLRVPPLPPQTLRVPGPGAVEAIPAAAPDLPLEDPETYPDYSGRDPGHPSRPTVPISTFLL